MIVTVKLSDETASRLAALAVRTGRSESIPLEEALALYLDDLEYLHGLLADLKEVDAGRMGTVSIDQLEAE